MGKKVYIRSRSEEGVVNVNITEVLQKIQKYSLVCLYFGVTHLGLF